MPQLKGLGASLVAITPEKPDHSLSTAEKNEISFGVLTDLGSDLAKKIGIAFSLPESLKPIYSSFGIDVEKHNGDFQLPVPATFVLDSQFKVLFRYMDLDYTKRMEPSEVVDFIKKQGH